METWIQAQVVQRCRRVLLACGLTLLLAGFVAWGEGRYVRNFVSGPYPVGQAELDAVQSVDEAPRYFVRAEGSKAIDTGLQEISVTTESGVEKSREVSASYYALLVGQRLLVFKSHSGLSTRPEGELKALPAELSRELFKDPEVRAVQARFYPFYLDDEGFRLGGYVAIGLGLVLAFVLFRKGLPAWRHLQDPGSHPVLTRVAQWGDPVGLAVEVEREVRTPHFKGGDGWLLTDRFLVRSRFFGFDLLRLRDLLWAYKSVTKHSVNFIPTGKTYAANLHCYGGGAVIPGAEKTVEQMLAFAAQRAPWAIFGFSKELQTHFTKNTRDFCAAVEQRRQQAAQAGG